MKHKLLLTTISIIFALQAVFVSTISYAAKPEISVVLDGKTLDFDVPPRIINDRTMVPMRAIFENLGYKVTWSGAEKKIMAQKDDITLELQINNTNINYNNKIITSDVPPQVVDDRTLVPVRIIAECSNCSVSWEQKTHTVIIETPQSKPDETAKDTSNQNPSEDETNTNDTQLSCGASVSKSVMSVGGYYRIVFSAVATGKGGTGTYKYKYELIQNGRTTKRNNFSNENAVEGTVEGSGECKLIFYVKDSSGNIAKTEIDLKK